MAAPTAREAVQVAVDLEKALKVASDKKLEELEHQLFLMEFKAKSFRTQIRKHKHLRESALAAITNSLVLLNAATEVKVKDAKQATAIVLACQKFGVNIHITAETNEAKEVFEVNEMEYVLA